jgi:hypothetical protein
MSNRQTKLAAAKLVLTFTATVLVALGTATNIPALLGNTNGYLWNDLKLKGANTEGGFSVGFAQACTWGCANGKCNGGCRDWAGDNFGFCESSKLQSDETLWSGIVRTIGGGSDQAKGYSDKLCACFKLEPGVLAALVLSIFVMLVEMVISSVRLACCCCCCRRQQRSTNRMLFVASNVLSILAALLVVVPVAAYGSNCNLIDNKMAFFAWATTVSPGVAQTVPLVASRTVTLEAEWGTGFTMALWGAIILVVCAIMSFFTGTCVARISSSPLDAAPSQHSVELTSAPISEAPGQYDMGLNPAAMAAEQAAVEQAAGATGAAAR